MDRGGRVVHFHVRLPGGYLKVKSRRFLRDYEIRHEVPSRGLFGIYFVWLSDEEARRRHRQFIP